MVAGQVSVAPLYEMTSAAGPDHDRVFECAVFHQGVELGRGQGKSKKQAEGQAAFAALERLRTASPAAEPEPKSKVES
jgi:ribonuclease-3